jgi:cytochrome c553
MKKIAVALLALPLAAFGATALAGDPAAGEAKADLCLDCHEPAEDFAGMSAEEIAAKIRAAQSGDFKHKDIINELPAEDIDDVAAWFAHEGAK